MNEAMKRRLERIEAEIERQRPSRLTIVTTGGQTQILCPVDAINLVWQADAGSIANITADRPEYAELAGVLTAVFGR